MTQADLDRAKKKNTQALKALKSTQKVLVESVMKPKTTFVHIDPAPKITVESFTSRMNQIKK